MSHELADEVIRCLVKRSPDQVGVADDEWVRFRQGLVAVVGGVGNEADAQLWLDGGGLVADIRAMERGWNEAQNQARLAERAAQRFEAAQTDPKARFDYPRLSADSPTTYEAIMRLIYVAGVELKLPILKLIASKSPASWHQRQAREQRREAGMFSNLVQVNQERLAEMKVKLDRGDEFGVAVQDELVQWAVGNYDTALIFGLVIGTQANIPELLTEYSRRVRSEPAELEIKTYLRWLVSEAFNRDLAERLEQELPKTGMLGTDMTQAGELATGLVFGGLTGQTEAEFDQWLDLVAPVMAANWETGNYRAREVRDNCARFWRRQLVARWEQAGVYEPRSHMPLELPAMLVAGAETEPVTLSQTENGGRQVQVKFPNGMCLAGIDLLEQNISVDELGLSLRPKDANIVMQKLRAHVEEAMYRGLTFLGREHLRHDRPNGAELRTRAGDWRILYSLTSYNGTIVLEIKQVALRGKGTYRY